MARDHEDARFRFGSIGAVALLALMLSAGCSVGLGEFGDGTAPPPPPTRRPALTVAPTIPAPTQEPSPLSLTPLASPTPPADAKRVTYGTFRKHLTRSFKAFEPLIRKLDRQLAQRDLAGSVQALYETQRWTSTEIAWLQSHLPRECYSEAHEVWSGAVSKWDEAFSVLERALDEVDPAGVERFARLIDEAEALLKDHPNAAGPRVCAR